MSKICNKCKIEKPLDAFYVCSKGKHGRRPNCKECKKELRRKEYLNNKKKSLELNRKWRQENRGKAREHVANYRYRKNKSSPQWLTKQHRQEILDIYREAKDLEWLNEESLHVDHIVPINGKNVCGLHVPWNLQILTASKNISKGNRV